MVRWFESQKTAHGFVGKAGEAHRIFVFSADTYGPEPDTPWQNQSEGKDLGPVLDFLLKQRGPTDVLLCFDGRSVKCRKALSEGILEKARNACDIWIIFQGTSRVGRRVAWASDNREIGIISLPIPRTALATKSRSHEAAAWSGSTHDSFYSGVPQAPWNSFPLLREADKERIMGTKPQVPPAKIFDVDRGMPLYWAERKPVAFWVDLLKCLDGKMVIDLSPGSGSVGRAALSLGIHYVAACRSESHASWLANVFDREACELITRNKSPLFEQTLAELIRTHFAEVLDQLHGRDGAVDSTPDEEVEADTRPSA